MLKRGDKVKVHYTGKYDDGEVFDSTIANEPISFTIGDEMMIPGFEEAVKKMTIGEQITVKLAAKDAYGEFDPSLIYVVKKDETFKERKIKVGDEVQIDVEDSIMILTVIDINDNEVKLDGNPEMAGKDVIFDIQLLDVIISEEEDYGEFENFENIEDFDEYSDDY